MQFGVIFFEESQGHNGFGALLYLVEKQQRVAGLDGYVDVFGNLGGNEAHVEVATEESVDAFEPFKIDLGEVFELRT